MDIGKVNLISSVLGIDIPDACLVVQLLNTNEVPEWFLLTMAAYSIQEIAKAIQTIN